MVHSRIVFGQLSPILADLVRQLLDDGTEVWDAASNDADVLSATVARVNANVVVVTSDRPAAPEHEALSRNLPGIVLVTLHPSGRTAARFFDGRLEIAADDLSPDTLRRMLRVE